MPTDLLPPIPPAPAEPLERVMRRLDRWMLSLFSPVKVLAAVYGPPPDRRACAGGLWVGVEAGPGCRGLPPSGAWCELEGALAARHDGRLVLVVRAWRPAGGA